MFAKSRIFLMFLALGMLVCALPAGAAPNALAKVDAVECPAVKLKHWQSSTNDEKLSFLFGIATMIEMEKEWQGSKPLPISKSTVGSWVNGLSGVTLGEMRDALDKYIVDHPDEMDRQVMEILGIVFVRPKMSPAMRQEAAEKYAKMSKAGK